MIYRFAVFIGTEKRARHLSEQREVYSAGGNFIINSPIWQTNHLFFLSTMQVIGFPTTKYTIQFVVRNYLMVNFYLSDFNVFLNFFSPPYNPNTIFHINVNRSLNHKFSLYYNLNLLSKCV